MSTTNWSRGDVVQKKDDGSLLYLIVYRGHKLAVLVEIELGKGLQGGATIYWQKELSVSVDDLKGGKYYPTHLNVDIDSVLQSIALK